jgi:transposase
MRMIVIGTDTHKRTHTCGAVDAFTAAARGELTAPARRASFGVLLRWARALDAERVWAIEDCRHVSGAFERFLVARGRRLSSRMRRLAFEFSERSRLSWAC